MKKKYWYVLDLLLFHENSTGSNTYQYFFLIRKINAYLFQSCFPFISLSFVYPPQFLYISLSIQIDAFLFQPHSLYLSLSLVYSLVPISISCLSRFTHITFNPLFLISAYSSYIGLYLFSSLCQCKFMAISFNALLIISVYPSYINPDNFLFLVYTPLSLFTFLSNHVHANIFQSLSIQLHLLILYILYY